MATLLQTSIVPNESLIGPLRVARRGPQSSGFRNVYPHRTDANGSTVYVARVKRAGRLVKLRGSDSTQPHVCALHVARWYEREFGPRWREALRSRWGQNPWRVRWSKAFKGFVASVWVAGRREEVVELRPRRDRWKATPRLAVFATKDDARAGIRLYLLRRYGLLGQFAELILWRGDAGLAA